MNKNMVFMFALILGMYQVAWSFEPKEKDFYRSDKDPIQHSIYDLDEEYDDRLDKYCVEYNMIKFVNLLDKDHAVLVKIRPDSDDKDLIIYDNTRVPNDKYYKRITFLIKKVIPTVRITIGVYKIKYLGDDEQLNLIGEYKLKIDINNDIGYSILPDGRLEKFENKTCEQALRRKKIIEQEEIIRQRELDAEKSRLGKFVDDQGLKTDSQIPGEIKSNFIIFDEAKSNSRKGSSTIEDIGNLKLSSDKSRLSKFADEDMREELLVPKSQTLKAQDALLYAVFPGAKNALKEGREPKWYEILGVDENATFSQKKKSFSRLSEMIKNTNRKNTDRYNKLFVILNSAVNAD